MLFLAVPAGSVWRSARAAGAARGARSARLARPSAPARRSSSSRSSSPTARSTGRFGPSHLVTRKMSFAEPALLRTCSFDPAPRPLRLERRCSLARRRAASSARRARERRDRVPLALLPPAFCSRSGSTARSRAGHRPGAFGSRRFVGATPVLACGPGARCWPASCARVGGAPSAAVLARLRVVERVADGAVRPQADGPPAARVAAGRGQPGHARCRATGARSALALLHRPRASRAKEGR